MSTPQESRRIIPIRPETSDVIVTEYSPCEAPGCSDAGVLRTFYYGQVGQVKMALCDRCNRIVMTQAWAMQKFGVWD